MNRAQYGLILLVVLLVASASAHADNLYQTIGTSTTTQNVFWVGNSGMASCMVFNNTAGGYNLTTVDFDLAQSAVTAFTVRLMNATYNGSAWNPSKVLATGTGFATNTPTGITNASGFAYVVQNNTYYAVCFDPGDSNAVFYRVGETTGSDVAKNCVSPAPNVNNLNGCTQWGKFNGGVTSIYMHAYGRPIIFTVQATALNGSLITGLCLLANATSTAQSVCTTTGTAVSVNVSGVYNLTVYSIGVGDNVTQTYYNQTLSNYNVSASSGLLTVTAGQALLNVTAYQGGTNYTINAFNVTNFGAANTTTISYCTVPALLGNNNIRVDVAGNTSMYYNVNVNQSFTITPFAATGIYDNVINSSGNGTVVTSAYNCSSANPPFGTTVSPYLTSDTTPTFRLTTNVNAACRIGNQNQNYTTMGPTRNCTSGDGLTQHICTLTSQDALPPEAGTVYIACKNTNDGTESAFSSSGPLPIIGIATTWQGAEDYGIHHSVVWPGATVYQNQQVYLRDLNNRTNLTTVDRVVVFGNQRWLLNYNNQSTLGLFNITPVVYSLEITNGTLVQIEALVTAFINGTKQ